jgi:hypothetical protein
MAFPTIGEFRDFACVLSVLLLIIAPAQAEDERPAVVICPINRTWGESMRVFSVLSFALAQDDDDAIIETLKGQVGLY